MKIKALLFVLSLAFFGFRHSETGEIKVVDYHAAIKDSIMPAITDTILLGDIDNDKIKDTAFVYTPPTLASFDEKGELAFEFGCVDNHCFNTIRFSNTLPSINVDDSVWGAIENAGDLDGDGFCELLFVPGWFTSSMAHLQLYHFKNGSWSILAKVDIRRDENTLKSHLVKKGKKHQLKGVDFADDDHPYSVEIKFPK